MLNTLHEWFVINDVNAGVPYFWHSPVGATSVIVIMVMALIKIFRAELDFITSLYNWALAGICAIALLHVHENSNPRHQMMTIVIALAVKKSWDVYKLLFRKEGIK